MCVAVPGKVIEVNPADNTCIVEVFGVTRRINTIMVGEVELGEYLIAHTGFAIEKLDLEEAMIRLKLWEEILSYADPGQVS
ncbi:MAG: HypC/HybG/HupF family hydrogenase formation chaperone [Eubacteriales bacterium]|jgi:hydrogenase expression/formation protein HypC|nr:HypC/HybG/HupF family hydrogenase formation chaperone [Bacillota bacterium]MBV1726566.1 HypC/HybG/HupF family hydrogenase formation chaperone [Desulforudis sp.]MDQ7788708.1 HypC/HybG/HupF family hydrogenase formation chaperone [Clostridia bacterium]MDZ4043271.1 HypC/HybG/HupF family hydrogenase formation chaperone [Eubacteriales bacterium]MBU4532072.1 HypC/HybG/HupF family hydrogenase formation chaperone [Bacillota bacterium]